MSPKEKMLGKIAKLMAKAESAEEIGNREEAAAFTAKVKELLQSYQIEEWEAQKARQGLDGAASSLKDRVQKVWFRPQEWGLRLKRKRIRWEEDLASTLARQFNCRHHILKGTNFQIFMGVDEDVDMVMRLYALLVKKFEKLSQRDYDRAYAKLYDKGLPTWKLQGYRSSWLDGAVRGIEDALRLQQNETTGTDLILVKANAVAEWYEDVMRDKKVKNAPSLASRKYNPQGYREGYAEGRSTPLHPELSS